MTQEEARRVLRDRLIEWCHLGGPVDPFLDDLLADTPTLMAALEGTTLWQSIGAQDG